MSTNVTLTGTLGRDPELKFTKQGKAVVTMSVVTSKSVKNDEGKWENREETWWRVTVWEAMAENVAETLSKGDPVIVVGRSYMEEYTDKDGNQRQSLAVNAYNVGLDLKRRRAQVQRVDRKVEAPAAGDPWAAPKVEEWTEAPF